MGKTSLQRHIAQLAAKLALKSAGDLRTDEKHRIFIMTRVTPAAQPMDRSASFETKCSPPASYESLP